MHNSSLSSISSTLSKPASTTAPGGGISRLNPNAKERKRKEAEEKERQAREAEERERKETEERKRKEDEERAAREEEEKAKAVTADTKAEPTEEGEVEEPEQTQDAADEAVKEEAKDKVSDEASLRIDTSLTSADGKRRLGRLNLSSTKSNAIPAPLPSALATARIIEDIGSIEYPEGIKSPKPELNLNAKQGKFRYDRDFLLQFMAVCREKPDSLPPLDAIGLEPVDQSFAVSRGGSHGHGRRSSSVAMPPPSSTTPRQASVGLGISGFSKPNVKPFNMGQFSTPKLSEERFAASNQSTSMSGTAGLPFGSSIQGGPGRSGWTRSQRGNKHDKERPRALEVSANRWTPASLVKKGQPAEQDSPEVVDRKVRALRQEAPPQGKRLQLLPRSVSVEDKSSFALASSYGGEDDTTSSATMSAREAKARIEEDSDEFFSIGDLNKADEYFRKLPAEHRHLLIHNLVRKGVEWEVVDAQLVADLFDRAHLKNLCSPAMFENGFEPTAESLDEIAIDAPKAFTLFAMMMKGAHLHEDEACRARLTGKSMNREKLFSLLSLPTPHIPRNHNGVRIGVMPLPTHASAYTSLNTTMARIYQTVFQFLADSDIDEAACTVRALPTCFHNRFIDILISTSVTFKSFNRDADTVCALLRRLRADGTCTLAAFEDGFALTAFATRDIVVDNPRALPLYLELMEAAGLQDHAASMTRLLSRFTAQPGTSLWVVSQESFGATDICLQGGETHFDSPYDVRRTR